MSMQMVVSDDRSPWADHFRAMGGPVLAVTAFEASEFWYSSLLLPGCLSLLSIFIWIFQGIYSVVRQQSGQDVERDSEERSDTSTYTGGLKTEITQHIKQRGGLAIFVWKLLRLATCLALVGLTIAIIVVEEGSDSPNSLTPPNNGILDLLVKWGKKRRRRGRHGGVQNELFTKEEWYQVSLCLVFLYTSLLSLLTLLSPLRRSRRASIHLVSILLATFAVYTYRDLWPLATFTIKPADLAEGFLLWTRVGLLAFGAVIIPLLIPRRYIPLDPKNPQKEINAEQTSSLLSFMLFSFLDPVIYAGYKDPHLSYEKFPPLCDYDRTEYLVERGFKILDPYLHRKDRYIFWSVMQVFWKEYSALTASLTIKSLSAFVAPLTINRLLAYIESGGEGALVRPWFWIAGMLLGPIIGSLAMNYYIYVTTGSLVRLGGMFTQLIFEHALRIRLVEKPEGGGQSSKGSSTGLASGSTSGTTTPLRKDRREVDSSHGSEATAAVGDESLAASSTEVGSESVPPVTDFGSSIPVTVTSTVVSPVSTEAKSSNLVGKINNLVTVDLENVIEGRDFLFLIWYTPFELTVCTYFLYKILDWSAFVGIITLIIVFPVPGFIARLINDVQEQRMKQTDARTQGVTEVMGVLRMVKLFAWEKKMHDRLSKQREAELEWVKYRQILQLCISTCNYTIPLLALITTYGSYTYIMKRELNASVVFSSIALFDMMKEQLHSTFFLLPFIIQAKVSLDRFDDFLKNSELLDEFKQLSGSFATEFTEVADRNEDMRVGFSDATFSWYDEGQSGFITSSRRNFRLRIQGDVYFMRNKINLIVGPTGSGKTSMLHALLGEMHFTPSEPRSYFNLPRQGGVAYAAQESWVQNETIKDNILFGSEMDKERYHNVLYQCGLKEDLKLFEAGDNTEVGEKGLTLSGGQKARITLARAVYSKAEILLLDDVLAALDVHTATWIVDKCLKGDLVKGRTVILVTHNVNLASPIADYVVSLGTDGKVVSQGSLSEALKKNFKLREEVKAEKEMALKEQKVIDPHKETKGDESSGKLVMAEEIAEGHVAWSALKMYFLALGGCILWTTVIVGCLAASALNTLQPWYLGEWARQYEHLPASEISVPHYLGVYTLIIILCVASWLLAFTTFFFGGVRASRRIYDSLVQAVLGTTMRWLDTVPTSRVITRCTQDIRAVDGTLPNALADIIDLIGYMLFRLVGVVVVAPLFFFPGVVVGAFGSICGQIYIKSQLSVKREMSNARAPVLGHFGAAIGGLTSLRAYGAQNAFRQESMRRVSKYNRCGRTFYNLNRWIGIRIDALGAIFTAALGTYLVYGGGAGIDASDIGFALSMAVSFSGAILWLVRILNDFEVQGNSLERIQNYLEIEQEPKPTEAGKPPAYWPASGDLVVKDLRAKYSMDGPEVLHGLDFSIKSGERIGVVGRTGSGKSSLTLSLLRCIFTSGTVQYDGIDTSKINLDALRSNITIIPQQPELITGTLRQNIDPFDETDDAALNDALASAGLFALQEGSDEGRLGLDSLIASGGSNLSVGQRQILALARAIIRGSKLLILDEATSAIDYETDNIIQTSIRRELKDVTLIMVAHRLQTIMDADRIMVLKAGDLVEYDTPANLLNKTDGLLYSLVNESSDRDKLYAMARANSMRTQNGVSYGVDESIRNEGNL